MRVHALVVIASAILAVATPTPTPKRSSHVVHERRDKTPQGWAKRSRVDGNFVLPLRIGLKQQNLDRAHEFLDSVSNPKSSKYGSYWSANDVVDMFAPRSALQHRETFET
jgi:tripeptidyl-peptidase I